MRVCKYCHCPYTGNCEMEPVGDGNIVKFIYPPWVVERQDAEPLFKSVSTNFLCCCPCHFIDNREYLKAIKEILGNKLKEQEDGQRIS